MFKIDRKAFQAIKNIDFFLEKLYLLFFPKGLNHDLNP